MTFARLWAFLAVALPTLGALLAGLSTVDLAYHLRAGADILAGRGIPSVDSWTFTAAGVPWVDQQWGAQVTLEIVHRAGGWSGLVVLRAALVGVIFWCLLEVGRRRGLGWRRSSWLTLAAFIVASPALGLRPQLLGMALFAATLLLVADRRAHPLRLWALPLVVLVWANVHGSFFLGPVVLGLAWLEDRHDQWHEARRTMWVAIAAALAACVTPFGPAVWTYAIGITANPAITTRITEWQPTSLHDVTGILFFSSVLAVVVVLVRRGTPAPWPTLAWLGVFFLIGAYAARGVAWWPLGASVALCSVLVPQGDAAPETQTAGSASIRRLNTALAGLLVLAGFVLIPWWRPPDPALGAPQGVLSDAPSGLTAALRSVVRPGDRLFNPQSLGSWFEYSIPELPVATDSRIEMFPVSVWDDYDRVIGGAEGWPGVLAAWNVTMVATTPDEQSLAARLTAARWHSTYSDVDGTILLAPDR